MRIMASVFIVPMRNFQWRVYYVKPDLENKIILGPQVPQERALDVEYDSNAHFMSFDTMIKWGGSFIQPYVGLLHDTTPSSRRVNTYPFPVNEDNLGTMGIDADMNFDKLNVGFEVARILATQMFVGRVPILFIKDIWHMRMSLIVSKESLQGRNYLLVPATRWIVTTY